MDSPPRLAELLMRLIVPERDQELVAGDLLEEFRLRCNEIPDIGAARRWYFRQALTSVWPFILMRCRRGEAVSALACVLILFAGPVILLCHFWAFALAQVPLRAAVPAPEYQAASGLCILLLAVLTGCAHGAWNREMGMRSLFPPAILVFGVAALFIPELVRHLPEAAWPVVMGVAPATACGVFLANRRRRSVRTRPKVVSSMQDEWRKS